VDRKYCKSDNIFYFEKRMLPHFGRVLYLLPMLPMSTKAGLVLLLFGNSVLGYLQYL
jgi:hypothetical protein